MLDELRNRERSGTRDRQAGQVVDRQVAGGNEQGPLAGVVDGPQVALRDVVVDGHREEELPVRVADDRLEATEQVEVGGARHPRSLSRSLLLPVAASPKAACTWRWLRYSTVKTFSSMDRDETWPVDQ